MQSSYIWWQKHRLDAHLHYNWHLSIPGHTDRCKSWCRLYTCLRSDTGCSHTRLCLQWGNYILKFHFKNVVYEQCLWTVSRNRKPTWMLAKEKNWEITYLKHWLKINPAIHTDLFCNIVYSYLFDTAGLYNQVHTDTGSRWPDLHRYRRSDRGHWHTRLCL